MAAQGTTTVNFGTFPGSADTSATVTGQAGISGAALVEAWIFPSATADHSADEHWVDAPLVFAGNVVAGTGFTIYATASGEPRAGINDQRKNRFSENYNDPRQTERAPLYYGLYTVAWCWS